MKIFDRFAPYFLVASFAFLSQDVNAKVKGNINREETEEEQKRNRIRKLKGSKEDSCPVGETLHEIKYEYDTTNWADNVGDNERGTLNFKLENGFADVKFSFAIRHRGEGGGEHEICIPDGMATLTIVDADIFSVAP